MTKRSSRKRPVTIYLDEERYRGLEFEAGLMTEVFGRRITAEDVALARLEGATQARDRRLRAG